MKAIVYTEYGSPDVLQLREVAKPIPKENEIRIRIKATTVNYGEVIARNFRYVPLHEFNMPMPLWLAARLSFGLRKPKRTIPGSEFAGEVEAVGQAVQRFKVGDRVFGYRSELMGAYAEYLCMPEDGVVAGKPINMTYEEAAALPYGAITALNLLEKVDIQPGQNVLINGASGGIGSVAVQLAKHHFGAEVTGVCSTPRVAFVKALGADTVIDYTKADFSQNGERYDLIFDILGRRSFSSDRNSLKPNGRQLFVSFKTNHLFQMLKTSILGNKKVICAMAFPSADALLSIKELVEVGKMKSLIDGHFPLAQAAEAHRYYEEGCPNGKVVITV